MGKLRSKPLDNLCEAIGDCRATKNQATTEEAGYLPSALKIMQQRGLSSYKHAGVELALVPGSDKLRVRLTKELSDAATGGHTDHEGDDQGLEPGTVSDEVHDQVGEGGGDDDEFANTVQ